MNASRRPNENLASLRRWRHIGWAGSACGLALAPGIWLLRPTPSLPPWNAPALNTVSQSASAESRSFDAGAFGTPVWRPPEVTRVEKPVARAAPTFPYEVLAISTVGTTREATIYDPATGQVRRWAFGVQTDSWTLASIDAAGSLEFEHQSGARIRRDLQSRPATANPAATDPARPDPAPPDPAPSDPARPAGGSHAHPTR